MNNWNEFGVCRTCEGRGFFVQPAGTIICPDCRGQRKGNIKAEVLTRQVCPGCGGLGYRKACCGQENTPCPVCTK